jgi:pimeloyl-ACP methyl ester carboxylesterase
MPERVDPSVERYRTRPETVATDRGDGPPLVLSHGTLMDRTMFAPQVEALSGDYRVLAFDSRARTDRYDGDYDLYHLADDCAALLDASDIDSCVIGGMSMGGFMALRFAERYPERVDGLVLVATTSGPTTRTSASSTGR